MVRPLNLFEKPLDWVGSSKKEFLAFPESVNVNLSVRTKERRGGVPQRTGIELGIP